MQITCESIEYIPISLDLSCHINKKITINITKIKNLKFDNGKNLIKITGKKFLMNANASPIFHMIPDRLAQFEILNEFDKDISPYYISRGKKTLNNKIINKDPQSLDAFMYLIYKKNFKVNHNVLSVSERSVIFEEVYFIYDEVVAQDQALGTPLIPEYTYDDLKVEKPEWYLNKETWEGNFGGHKFFPLVGKMKYISSDFGYRYDYFVRHGISLLKKRIIDYLDIKEVKYKGIYISRSFNTNKFKEYYEDYKNRENNLSEEEANHFKNVKYMLSQRCYLKEQQIEDYFKSIGFEILTMEFLSYKEQLSYLFNTKNVVALTGSGLVNTFICNVDTNIYEIMLPRMSVLEWYQNFFFLFSPVPGCILEKGLPSSCIQDRKWTQITSEEEALNPKSWFRESD